jgi:hypothetical protein
MAGQMPAMIEALELIHTRPQQAIRAMQSMVIEAENTLSQTSLDLSRAIKKKPGRKPREGAPVVRAATSTRKPKGRGAANTG